MDRYIEIPQSCNGVARFDFEYLCGRPVISHSLVSYLSNNSAGWIKNKHVILLDFDKL